MATSRQFENYVDGLKQVLNSEKPQPKEIQSLKELLKEEKLLYSREIEEIYDINLSDIDAFVQKELLDHQYEMNKILGELYISLKN